MRVRRAVIAIAVVAATLGGALPAAAEQEPHITDPCGVPDQLGDPTVGATSPWTDICAGWFSTLQDGLRVTATFAGDIPDNRLGYYYAQWRAGDCEYRLTHDRGLGRYEAEGVFVADPGADWLRIRCGEAEEVECGPGSFGLTSCWTYPDTRFLTLDDAVAVDGNTVTWTVRWFDELAPVAAELAPGTTLTSVTLYAANKAFIAAAGPGVCSGTACTQFGSDFAYGGPYTVGQ